jgi:predicted CXXCH cytochrome family protein
MEASVRLFENCLDQLRQQPPACPASAEVMPVVAPSPERRKKRIKRTFTDKACLNCHSQHTSQWRTGPAGSSTYALTTQEL